METYNLPDVEWDIIEHYIDDDGVWYRVFGVNGQLLFDTKAKFDDAFDKQDEPYEEFSQDEYLTVLNVVETKE